MNIPAEAPANTPLRQATSQAWLTTVMGSFDEFLADHAANERKASSMAMSLVSHYPDKAELVSQMIDLALEELNHFRQVYRLMVSRGLILAADEKDPYVNALLKHIRKGTREYFLDRLLSAAVIEARGAERFEMLANAALPADITTFYRTLARSERNHYQLFIHLANLYFPDEMVESQFKRWLDLEAETIDSLTIRPRLH